MTESTTPEMHGLVLYIDGSFRKERAGWGMHGYTYTETPMKRGIGVKDTYPTAKGYEKVPMEDSVSVLEYHDSFGCVEGKQSNNTGELKAMIEAFTIALNLDVPELYVLSDSKLTLDGANKYIHTWLQNGWLTSKGEPVANTELWKELVAVMERWKATGRRYKLVKVAGHSGNLGNDLSDFMARCGSANADGEHVHVTTPPDKYHTPNVEAHPLLMKTRMVFNIGMSDTDRDQPPTYYCYQLGLQRNYGHKQGDSKRDRHQKNDLLFGRRISDATFGVIQFPTPDPYLEKLKEIHAECHTRDVVDIVIGRLDNAYKPKVHQHINRFGAKGLENDQGIGALITPHDDLISKTHTPPRLARDGLETFGVLEDRLTRFRQNTLGRNVVCVDITSYIYATEELPSTSKKTPKIKLQPEITNTTLSIDIPVTYGERELTLRMVPGVDIPMRNPLAKLAEYQPTVTVMIVPEGPDAYSFATVFDTHDGIALYQCPYTQFIVPKERT